MWDTNNVRNKGEQIMTEEQLIEGHYKCVERANRIKAITSSIMDAVHNEDIDKDHPALEVVYYFLHIQASKDENGDLIKLDQHLDTALRNLVSGNGKDGIFFN
jgi:hypothetical protein